MYNPIVKVCDSRNDEDLYEFRERPIWQNGCSVCGYLVGMTLIFVCLKEESTQVLGTFEYVQCI
jgi:hypothetical protein